MDVKPLDDMKNAVGSIKLFTDICENTINFTKELFTNPINLLYKGIEAFAKGFQVWGPEAMLLSLFILIVLYFFGFKKTKKWIVVIFAIGMFLASF